MASLAFGLSFFLLYITTSNYSILRDQSIPAKPSSSLEILFIVDRSLVSSIRHSDWRQAAVAFIQASIGTYFLSLYAQTCSIPIP